MPWQKAAWKRKLRDMFLSVLVTEWVVGSLPGTLIAFSSALMNFNRLDFDNSTGALCVVIETPKGSRNKFDWDFERQAFNLGGVLTAGASFPYDFGFVPGTRGEDGDPLDVLVLMDEPAFPGCLVEVRLIGVIEAEQTERDGTSMRNDRLVAVSQSSHLFCETNSLDDIAGNILEEIEHFFVSYNTIKGKEFVVLARGDAERAIQLVQEGATE